MISASQLLYRHMSSPQVDGTEPTTGVCWVCGGEISEGIHFSKWSGSTFVDQNRIRGRFGEYVCSACVFIASRTSPVPGRPAKEGKKFGGNYRNYSHMLDSDGYVNASKGEKPTVLAWLRKAHKGPWFAAIADSGQKHIVPFCPLNPDGCSRGLVMFDESLIRLPRSEDWQIVDDATVLLTGGVTKAELETGEYTEHAWSLCGEKVERFETDWGRFRGGPWFRLVVFLSQRDEDAVADRIEKEKEKKSVKTNSERKRNDANASGRGASRSKGGIPSSGSKRHKALDHPGDADAECGAKSTGPGRVVHADVEGPTTGGGKSKQLSLFG